jgi:hypothetical protein
MSSLRDLKDADHAPLWSFEGMLLPLDSFFSTFGESIRSLISFDHLKIGRASRRGGFEIVLEEPRRSRPYSYASIRTGVGPAFSDGPVHDGVRPDLKTLQSVTRSPSKKRGHRIVRSRQRDRVFRALAVGPPGRFSFTALRRLLPPPARVLAHPSRNLTYRRSSYLLS